MNDRSVLKRILLFIATIIEKIFMSLGFVLMRNTPFLPNKRRMDMSFRAWDFTRYSSLELVADEIETKGVRGNVAELGVYQGTFASKLNELFKNRKLYLFDTFEGFTEADKKIEKDMAQSAGINADFKNTSVQYVLQKMKYKENCIVKAGYFPETAKGLEDHFCFVSIDADLYQPIYEGLRFFYPRLSKGGYIFVHDFNNKIYPGSKKAVMKYCSENDLAYFPLSDVGGTAIILK